MATRGHGLTTPAGPSFAVHALATVLVGLACAGMFEFACQVYARAVLFRRLDRTRAHPLHFYAPADSRILAYDLRPGVEIEHADLRLRINRHRIRDAQDDSARGAWRLAVLGDSVVFGFGHAESRTLSGLLQAELDPTRACLRVLNFGLGGLNLEELVEFLRLRDDVYDVDEVVFLVNPNDYARRESVYEGADNALYRTYRRPTFMTVFFLRKSVYRWMKRGGSAPVRWYRWMFEGNEEWGAQQLRRLGELARERGISIAALLLPSLAAYRDDGGYALSDMYARMGVALDRAGIPYVDPTDAFRPDPARYLDDTDHLRDAGNVFVAGIMRDLLESRGGVPRPRCPAGSR
jgi:hypothetical protein